MFQGHAGTGLLFLAGIALASPVMLLGAIIGAIVGPLTASLARWDRSAIEQGLYGFNPTLVGLALPFFLRPTHPLTWLLVVVGGVASVFVTHLGMRFLKFPAYTSPFVVVTWLAIVLTHAVAGQGIDVPAPAPAVVPGGFVERVLRGEAEVMLGAGVATGVLFLVGIALSNPWHAAIALLGSVVGTAQAAYHGDPSASASIGIYGYNASLAAMALFLVRPTIAVPVLAAIVSTCLTEFFPKALGLPALTAPFVVASWAVLGVLWLEARLWPRSRV
jgi:urea transporter